MPDHVEAESVEAKRFLTAFRGLLAVPKSEIDKKIARKRKKRARDKPPKAR